MKRKIKANNVTTKKGKALTVKISLLPQGDEVSMSFSLKYDPVILDFVSLELVKANAPNNFVIGGTNTNEEVVNGKLGILADGANDAFAKSKSYVDVLLVKFKAAAVGVTKIEFTDKPAPKSVSNNMGALLPTEYVGGRVNVKR